jgi:hypothetical protein
MNQVLEDLMRDDFKYFYAVVLAVLISAGGARATVTSQSTSVTFTCTGSVGPYAFTFPISDAASLTVIKAGTTLASTAYTIAPTNNNYANGGKVTLNTACSTGTLVLQRNTPLTQTSVFTDNMPVPMKTFERGLDKLTEANQDMLRYVNGIALHVPVVGPLTDMGGQVFNVKAYGTGVGTGNATIDTAAIQAAANASGEAGPYFPCGSTYKINSTITLAPNADVTLCGYGNTTTPSGAIVEWTGATNGPIFEEIGVGISPTNGLTRGAQVRGGTFINGGTATALIGFRFSNLIGPSFDHMAMHWSGGTCINLRNTNANYPLAGGTPLWSERASFGSDLNLDCGAYDIDLTVDGGSSSFGYINILGPHLDNGALHVGIGADLYHSAVIFKFNSGNPVIKIDGTAANNWWDVRGETATHFLELAAGTLLEGQGILDCASCGSDTIGSGAKVFISANSSTDGGPHNTTGLIPSSNRTTLVAADHTDFYTQAPTVGFGLYSNYSNLYGGVWLNTNTIPGRGCYRLSTGDLTTLDTNTQKAALCDDSTLQLTGVAYSVINAPPYTSLPNGTMLFCSDCNATCTAGSGTGRTCFRENGTWTH